MINRSPKVPVKVMSGKNKGKIRYVRRARNEEVMLESIKHRGYIRTQIIMRLLPGGSSNYTSWQGSSLTVDMPDVASAKKFQQALGDAVYRVAKECGCSMPDVVEVPKES
jgi:hypothetical protein